MSIYSLSLLHAYYVHMYCVHASCKCVCIQQQVCGCVMQVCGCVMRVCVCTDGQYMFNLTELRGLNSGVRTRAETFVISFWLYTIAS